MNGDLDELRFALPYLSLIVAGWIVRTTIVPAQHQGALALVLCIATVGAGVAIARHAGFDLDGGRCRASTNDGARCKLSRGPGDDLCHVHQRTHDATLHPDGIEEKR